MPAPRCATGGERGQVSTSLPNPLARRVSAGSPAIGVALYRSRVGQASSPNRVTLVSDLGAVTAIR